MGGFNWDEMARFPIVLAAVKKVVTDAKRVKVEIGRQRVAVHHDGAPMNGIHVIDI